MLLYMLAVNMEPMVWGELVLELQQILKEHDTPTIQHTTMTHQQNPPGFKPGNLNL